MPPLCATHVEFSESNEGVHLYRVDADEPILVAPVAHVTKQVVWEALLVHGFAGAAELGGCCGSDAHHTEKSSQSNDKTLTS